MIRSSATSPSSSTQGELDRDTSTRTSTSTPASEILHVIRQRPSHWSSMDYTAPISVSSPFDSHNILSHSAAADDEHFQPSSAPWPRASSSHATFTPAIQARCSRSQPAHALFSPLTSHQHAHAHAHTGSRQQHAQAGHGNEPTTGHFSFVQRQAQTHQPPVASSSLKHPI